MFSLAHIVLVVGFRNFGGLHETSRMFGAKDGLTMLRLVCFVRGQT